MMAYVQFQRQILMLAYRFALLQHSFHKTSLIHLTVSSYFLNYLKKVLQLFPF